jgi:hypothetical protein
VIVLGATAGIGTAAWSVDDKGGQQHHRITEPGDDNGGLRTPSSPRTSEAGDDNGRPGKHVEPGDDNGGLRAQAEPGDDNDGQGPHTEPGDDKGGQRGHTERRSGSSSDDGAGHR